MSMVSERFKLKQKSGTKIRLHIGALVVIVLASLVIGYLVSENGLIGGNDISGENIVSMKDVQFFIDQSNKYEDNWRTCEKNLFLLGFSLAQDGFNEIII